MPLTYITLCNSVTLISLFYLLKKKQKKTETCLLTFLTPQYSILWFFKFSSVFLHSLLFHLCLFIWLFSKVPGFPGLVISHCKWTKDPLVVIEILFIFMIFHIYAYKITLLWFMHIQNCMLFLFTYLSKLIGDIDLNAQSLVPQICQLHRLSCDEN